MYENVPAASAVRHVIVETEEFTVSIYVTRDEDHGITIFVYDGPDYTLFKLIGWCRWQEWFGPVDEIERAAHSCVDDLCAALKAYGNTGAGIMRTFAQIRKLTKKTITPFHLEGHYKKVVDNAEEKGAL